MAKPTPTEVMDALKKNGRRLRGERIAILRDDAEDTFGNSTIIKAETHKFPPLSGTIVAVGNKVNMSKESIYPEMEVHFNRFNVIQFEIDLPELSEPVALDVLHISDLYWDGGE